MNGMPSLPPRPLPSSGTSRCSVNSPANSSPLSMMLPRDNIVELRAGLARRQATNFAPGIDPSARTCGGCLLASAVLVVVDEERERPDAGENREIGHVVGTARRPSRLQECAAMADVES